MVNEHVNWKNHINIIKNKLSKNLGLLYKAKKIKYKNNEKPLLFTHFYLCKLWKYCMAQYFHEQN